MIMDGTRICSNETQNPMEFLDPSTHQTSTFEISGTDLSKFDAKHHFPDDVLVSFCPITSTNSNNETPNYPDKEEPVDELSHLLHFQKKSYE